MTKEKRKLVKDETDDEADDGDKDYVSDESAGEGSEEARPAKKAKKASSSKKAKPKNESSNADLTVHEGEDGAKYISLGKNRRLTVRKYSGKPLVDIREYYVDKKDEVEKPGKKGISLTKEQWDSVKQSMSAVDNLLADL